MDGGFRQADHETPFQANTLIEDISILQEVFPTKWACTARNSSLAPEAYSWKVDLYTVNWKESAFFLMSLQREFNNE